MVTVRRYVLIASLLFLTGFAFGIPDSLINRLDFTSNDEAEVTVHLGNPDQDRRYKWLYYSFDNPEIKSLAFRDSAYNILKQTQLFLQDDDSVYKDDPDMVEFYGVSWYKLYFKLRNSHVKTIQYMVFNQLGASEIYLDGKLLRSYGKTDQQGKTTEARNVTDELIPFYVDDTLPHFFAIRYSLSDYEAIRQNHDHSSIGPVLAISNIDHFESGKKIKDIAYSVTNMLAAFFFALFLIHLMIFFFYREKNFNLYYSLFLLSLSLCFLEIYFVKFIENINTYLWVSDIDALFFPACCFFLVTLLNKLLNVERTKHYIFFLILMGLLVVDTIFSFGFGNMVTISIVFYTYFNTLAHAIVGVRKKITSARFLGWGVLGFTISLLTTILFALILAFNDQSRNQVSVVFFFIFIVLGILSVPLSMSAYLAYDFSQTNRSLKEQLDANMALSKKTIEQEKEKQELLANQNKMLEFQVKERTREIESQKNLIETKQKEIIDSIKYAKRIQNSLLPQEKFIEKTLNRFRNGKG